MAKYSPDAGDSTAQKCIAAANSPLMRVKAPSSTNAPTFDLQTGRTMVAVVQRAASQPSLSSKCAEKKCPQTNQKIISSNGVFILLRIRSWMFGTIASAMVARARSCMPVIISTAV